MDERKNNSKSEILPLRDQIDHVDRKIMSLIAERLRLVGKIGEIKRKMKLPVKDSVREKEKIESLINQGKNLGISPDIITKVWGTFFEISYDIEKPNDQKIINKTP